jgi:hypothetical protein
VVMMLKMCSSLVDIQLCTEMGKSIGGRRLDVLWLCVYWPELTTMMLSHHICVRWA